MKHKRNSEESMNILIRVYCKINLFYVHCIIFIVL